MKRRSIRATAAICALVTLFFAFGVDAGANSAQSYWHGVDAAGAIVTGERSPITVKHEALTFDIPEFPENYYSSAEQFENYSAKVSARYELYNPSDYTVSATLVFPFGTAPDYLYDCYYENPTFNSGAYGASINGEAVETTVRHTFEGYGYYGFDVESDLPKLHEDFKDDPFYKQDTPVNICYYTINAPSGYPEIFVCLECDFDKSKTRLVATEFGQRTDERLCTYARNGETLNLSFIGEMPTSGLKWSFYTDYDCKTAVNASISPSEKQNGEISFKEYALGAYDAESGVLEHDFYNATVDMLSEFGEDGIIFGHDTNVSDSLMQWYEYEISIEPHGTLINTVTAPLYPSIDADYEPPIYEYTYLLSPAKGWADFGTLDITVNTPYYITESSVSLEKTDGGYKASFDSLPDGELRVTLSESENPEQKGGFGILLIFGIIGTALLFIITLPFTLISGLFSIIKNAVVKIFGGKSA